MQIKQQLVKDTPYKFGRENKKRYITIHETDNWNKGANAQAHARLQSNGNARGATWHWQVDDKEAIQSFTHDFQLYHGGDGTKDKDRSTSFIDNGNLNSIGIEICVNSDGDFKKAVENAAKLTAKIMKEENISIQDVKQHNHWSGKNCPRFLRSGEKGINWNDFIKLVKEEMKVADNKPSEWAKSVWEKQVKQGYFDGTNPRDGLTREQGAALIDRLVSNIKKYHIEPLELKVAELERKVKELSK